MNPEIPFPSQLASSLGDFKRQQDPEQQKLLAQQKEIEEKRRIMMRSVLTSDAQERLSRIALVKPEKARKVEDFIIQNARMGKIIGKLEDDKLISLLEAVDASSGSGVPKVTIQRRRIFDDDEYDV